MKLQKIDISEIDGFRLGNAENRIKGTGCTAIICEKGAVGGVDVRGGAPATRETDLLRSENTVEKVNAVVLSGGSAFGLESASGVMRALADRGVGFSVGEGINVPIVCGASLFDLAVGDSRAFPDVNMGIDAVRNAYRGGFRHGVYGAGTGATVGKMLGHKRAMKTGLGTFACGDDRIKVGAVVAVNACGDVYNAAGSIIAGLRTEDGSAIYGTRKALKKKVYEGMDVEVPAANREAILDASSEKKAEVAVTDEKTEISIQQKEAAIPAKKTEPVQPAPAPVKKKQTIANANIAKAIEAEYIKKTRIEIEELKRKLETGELVRSQEAKTADPDYAGIKESQQKMSFDTVTPESPEDEYLAIYDDSFTVHGDELKDLSVSLHSNEKEINYASDADDRDFGYDIPFNTTIGCLITNAVITKSQANKLASILHDAYARAIKPVHSTLDGDTIFVLSTCTQEVNFDAFAALATDVMQYAIIDGASSARGAYGLPSAGEL